MADRGWVGVVSTTQRAALDLIEELGLSDATPISPRQGANRMEGMRLHAVLIDEQALPLPADVRSVLYGNLLKTCGHGGMYSIRRIV